MNKDKAKKWFMKGFNITAEGYNAEFVSTWAQKTPKEAAAEKFTQKWEEETDK